MRLNLTVHTGDPHRVTILEGTPQGALPTEGVLMVGGALMVSGLAPALRRLAADLGEAAAQAELYDADPDAYRAAQLARRERQAGLGEAGDG